MSDKEREVYDRFKRDLVVSLKGEEIDAGNAAVLSGKLAQMANGAVYGENKRVLPIHERQMTEGGEKMPKRPKRPCSHPGCPNLTDGRFCTEHEKQEASRYEKYDRDPAVRRRYGRAWKRIRDRYIAAHPLCEQWALPSCRSDRASKT